ncbi:MAG: hypothetical protein GY928_14635 [Colwellia sp.]|nr:hypothetical protein [Colwellia sp.]
MVQIKRIPDLADWEGLHPGDPVPTNAKQAIWNPSDNITYQVEQTAVGQSPFERDDQNGMISPKNEGDSLDMKNGCLSDYRSEGSYVSGTGDASIESSLVSTTRYLIQNPLFGNSRTITIPDAQPVECGRTLSVYLDGVEENTGQVSIRTTAGQEINRETLQTINQPGKGFTLQEYLGEWLIVQDSRPTAGVESIFIYPTPVNITDPSSYFKLVFATDDPDYPQTEQIATGALIEDTGVDVYQGAWTTETDSIRGTFPSTSLTIDAKLNILDPGGAGVTTYAQLHKRDSLGVETLLSTSIATPVIASTQTLYSLVLFFNEVTLEAGDRFVFKFYATKVSGNPPADNNVQFAIGGFDNPARISLPLPPNVLKLDVDDINGLRDELDILAQMPLIVSQFDSNTTMSDPGAGKFRINAGGTQIAISHQEPSGSNINIHLNQFITGSTLKTQAKGDDSKYKNINITGARINNTTWSIIPITIDNEGTALILDDFIGIIFTGGISTPLINATFDDGITDVDPGAGNFRYNNATQSAATQLNINEETGLNAAITIEILDSLKNGATAKLECLTDINKWAVVKLSADAVNASTFTRLPLTVISKGADFEASDHVAFALLQTGNLATTITATPTIAATVLDIDFEGNSTYETTSEVIATASHSITVSNADNARNGHVDYYISNSIIITLPANSLMQDDEDRWTPSPTYQITVDGLTGNSYELSFRKVGTKLKWILSNKFE